MTLEDVSGFDMASAGTNRDKEDWDIPLKRLNSDDDIKVRSVVSALGCTTPKQCQISFCCYAAPPLHWGILLLPTKAGAASAQPCMHTDNDQVN